MVNINKLEFVDGFSPDEEENTYFGVIIYDKVVKHWVDYKNDKIFGELLAVDASDDQKTLGCVECDLCGDTPCVWKKSKLANVVANDQLEHGNTSGIENKTRRRVAYRYMFRMINGSAGQKGALGKKDSPNALRTASGLCSLERTTKARPAPLRRVSD
jgi:hypothetical protein